MGDLELKQEISSTEKLLEFIRSRSSVKSKAALPETSQTPPDNKSSFLPSRKQSNSISIGVDLGKKDIKLAKNRSQK